MGLLRALSHLGLQSAWERLTALPAVVCLTEFCTTIQLMKHILLTIDSQLWGITFCVASKLRQLDCCLSWVVSSQCFRFSSFNFWALNRAYILGFGEPISPIKISINIYMVNKIFLFNFFCYSGQTKTGSWTLHRYSPYCSLLTSPSCSLPLIFNPLLSICFLSVSSLSRHCHSLCKYYNPSNDYDHCLLFHL